MTIQGPLTADAVLTAFDDYLRRVRGVCPEARHNYMIHARNFLETVFGEGPVDFARVGVGDVATFVTNASSRYQPPTVQLLATALRSLLRFARAEGLSGSRLDEAVPAVRQRPASLPRHLGSGELAGLLSSLDSSSPRGLRDRAMLLLGGRLGLRASEIARLELDDIDWRSGTVTIRTRKTGHGAVLPLT
ncbi:MAG: tyrosine-type recombinase/integrase [Actinomycetota bacterium]|nr:tyrosine-type recombinase/integrase [Actinomycetota bacterium]